MTNDARKIAAENGINNTLRNQITNVMRATCEVAEDECTVKDSALIKSWLSDRLKDQISEVVEDYNDFLRELVCELSQRLYPYIASQARPNAYEASHLMHSAIDEVSAMYDDGDNDTDDITDDKLPFSAATHPILPAGTIQATTVGDLPALQLRFPPLKQGDPGKMTELTIASLRDDPSGVAEGLRMFVTEWLVYNERVSGE